MDVAEFQRYYGHLNNGNRNRIETPAVKQNGQPETQEINGNGQVETTVDRARENEIVNTQSASRRQTEKETVYIGLLPQDY